MSPIIKGFGEGVRGNFDHEGLSERRWQGLSAMTRGIRRKRGYPADRPVMTQSGQLDAVSATPFMKWGPRTKRSTRKVNAPYGKVNPLAMSASLFQGRFTATVSGRRVENQYGRKMPYAKKRFGTRDRYRQSALPARPFFVIDHRYIEDGMPKMMDALMRKWRESAAKGMNVK
jgi:hypothetical protein